MPLGKEELKGDEADLEDPLELKPVVASFLQGVTRDIGS